MTQVNFPKKSQAECLRANLEEDGGRWLSWFSPPSRELSSSVSELKLLLSVKADFFPPSISPGCNGKSNRKLNHIFG